jgi:hypothetical protein
MIIDYLYNYFEMESFGFFTKLLEEITSQSGNIDIISSMTESQRLLLKISGSIDTEIDLVETVRLLLKRTGNIDSSSSLLETRTLLLKVSGIIEDITSIELNFPLGYYYTSGVINLVSDLEGIQKALLKESVDIDAICDLIETNKEVIKGLGNIDIGSNIDLSGISLEVPAIINCITSMIGDIQSSLSTYKEIFARISNISKVHGKISISKIIGKLN